VADLDRLLRAGEQHGVLADDRAATHSVDAQLAGLSFLANLAAVRHRVQGAVERLVQLVGDHQGGAGWCVDFLVVVGFDDLNVKAGVEQLGGLAGQVDQ